MQHVVPNNVARCCVEMLRAFGQAFRELNLDSRTRTTTTTRFSHRTIVSASKPASFWREKRDTGVILVQGFAKMLSCHNKSTTRKQF